ncbi:MAG: HEPN domain-containing protein [Anaerolineales bacterium]|uniref:HEPN domain-containing protein n=1 Tax=Candidatus Desulfolinea nitratireducens TaxID=2841698 RepID=A0A8J6THA7_9CHLR|nr:HEPN domain-containing protein [Candidatus Desulfolinea nitratireducens]MBL6961652.1 HEPN domain-containing protein [Anaerolineales bacterium]
MKDEAIIWLKYAKENFQSAVVLSESELFNPCLQNIQQCVEKALKALLVENSIKLKRTHGISDLRNILLQNGLEVDISEDDCEFLDSIYLPSKYPLSNVLPHYEPDHKICAKGILIARNILKSVE